MSLPRGIYRIHSADYTTDKGTDLNITLASGARGYFVPGKYITYGPRAGEGSDVAALQGWEYCPSSIDDLWLVNPLDDGQKSIVGAYCTFQSVLNGTFMNLRGDSKDDNTEIIGYRREETQKNENWKLEVVQTGGSRDIYRLVNESQGTCAVITASCCKNASKITAFSVNSQNSGSSRWTVSKVSFDAQEIEDHFAALKQKVQVVSSKKSKMLLGLPIEVLRDVWSGWDFRGQELRKKCCHTDLALLFKAAVAEWANENVKADGVMTLCGVAYCEKANGVGAEFNWTIDPNTSKVIFFDPQTGVSRDDPWGFSIKVALY